MAALEKRKVWRICVSLVCEVQTRACVRMRVRARVCAHVCARAWLRACAVVCMFVCVLQCVCVPSPTSHPHPNIDMIGYIIYLIRFGDLREMLEILIFGYLGNGYWDNYLGNYLGYRDMLILYGQGYCLPGISSYCYDIFNDI